MTKIKFSLTAVMAILFGLGAFAQTLNLDFSILDANSTVLGTGSNTAGPSTPGPIIEVEIDLRNAGVCAGDQIFIQNNSSGWIYSNTPANTITSSTEWALIRGQYWGNLNFSTCGSFILGGSSTAQAELWSPNPLSITVPDATGCADNIGNGYHTACFLLSPDVYYYNGQISTANCERAIELRLIVNSRPDCLGDLELCPSMKEPYIQDAIEDHIPSNLTAYDWTPFDPRTTSFVTNTNFTVWLENADGTGCARECNFDITWAQPTHQIIQNGSICEDQAPYLGISVDNLAISNTSSLLINGVEVYPNPANSSIFDDYFGTYDQLALTEPGLYTIQQEFLMNDGSTCTKEYEVTIYESPEISLYENYNFCKGLYQTICGPSPVASGQNYQYLWSYEDPIQGVVSVVSNNQCYLPSAPGNYSLYVTNGSCSAFHSFTVTEIPDIVISVPDLVWCKKMPAFVSPQQSFSSPVASYTWTYNGNSVSSTYHNIPYMGDGTYCVTVHWENGCMSTDCFKVYRDCAPAPKSDFTTVPNPSTGEFQLIFDSSSDQKEITVRTTDGRIVVQKTVTQTSRTNIDLSGFPKGIYFIEVIGTDSASLKKVRIQ